MDHGLRIGIQGVSLSPTLSKLIDTAATAPTEAVAAELQKDPLVGKKYHQLMPGMQVFLTPYPDSIPEMPLFWFEGGQFCGKTFKDAQGLIGLVATPLKNGQVQFEITPEIVHGTTVTKYRFQGGALFPEVAKPKHIFYNLSVSLDLLPGQWIVIGPVSEHCSGIGRCFFTRDRGETEQKVVLLRLAKSQRDAVFENMPLPVINPFGEDSMLERN
jgi:hypothetical protein